MLDMKFVRENPDVVRDAIAKKALKIDFDRVLSLDEDSRSLTTKMQDLGRQRNELSKAVKSGDAAQRDENIQAARRVGEEIAGIKKQLNVVTEELEGLQALLPLPPSDDMPVGPDDASNVVVKTWGDAPKGEPGRDHVDIANDNQWIELERAAKVAGSRSYILKNELLRLELALHAVALDMLSAGGFDLMSAPALVKEEALFGTGHFPSAREDIYDLPRDNLYLAGTAEVALNSIYAGEVLDQAQLPILMAGYSPCFRREAGSAGRDVRGLLRVHQFWKVEQFVICEADVETSNKYHELLLSNAEKLLQQLDLPYQIVACSTGDMGTGKYRMHDIEVWMPSAQKYRETHSCSSLLDWQARRTNTRYRDGEGKMRFPYTLNNTAVATPRILVALLENHLQEDGSIAVPEVLRNYMGGVASIGGRKPD